MPIDIDKLYRILDSTTIHIPEPTSGASADLNDIACLLAKVHNNRNTLDTMRRRIAQKLGNLKHRIDIDSERLRLERSKWSTKPEVRDATNKEQRDALLDYFTKDLRTKLAQRKANARLLDGVLASVEAQDRQLQHAKETLNGIKSIALAEIENL